jgi:PleD family two-component response regulator
MRKADRDIVLVVDDSPETLRLLTDALEEAGMTVLVARAGEHALSIVEKVVPDVVLMDALMPGTDGFATCRKLKQNRALAHVPIIFMTGLSDTEHIIKGLEAGGVDYITKADRSRRNAGADSRASRQCPHGAQRSRRARCVRQIPSGGKPYRPRPVVHAAGGKASRPRVRRF